MAKAITKHEVVSTFEHSQYWHGEGLSFTNFTDIATGCGVCESEACTDALDQLASNGWDTTTLDLDQHSTRGPECECAEGDECEHLWYYTIRVTGEHASEVLLNE